MNEKQYTEILGRLRQLCSKSEKCEFDIIQKIEQWNVEPEMHGKIIEELKKENFLNNERYANSFVNDKIRFVKWGKIKIKYFLKQNQIDERAIDAALTAFPTEEYKKICYSEIQKKYKTLKTKHRIAAKQKLISFARQRGYESSLIFEVVNGVLK